MKMSAITHRYQEEDVVTCLNRISSLNLNKDRQHQHHNNETTSVIQIAFIGDSTIRHLFNSFIRVIFLYKLLKSINLIIKLIYVHLNIN